MLNYSVAELRYILIVYCAAEKQKINLLVVEMCEKTMDFHD